MFDQGGLKRMPDGTLESVHIPGPEAEKPEMIPYLATGTGGPPKPKPPVLEWRVEFNSTHVVVSLYELVVPPSLRRFSWATPLPARVDGSTRAISKFGLWWRKPMKRLEREIAEAKEDILRFYDLTKRESGRVE